MQAAHPLIWLAQMDKIECLLWQADLPDDFGQVEQGLQCVGNDHHRAGHPW